MINEQTANKKIYIYCWCRQNEFLTHERCWNIEIKLPSSIVTCKTWLMVTDEVLMHSLPPDKQDEDRNNILYFEEMGKLCQKYIIWVTDQIYVTRIVNSFLAAGWQFSKSLKLDCVQFLIRMKAFRSVQLKFAHLNFRSRLSNEWVSLCRAKMQIEVEMGCWIRNVAPL